MSAANAVNIDAVVIGGGPAGSAAARLLTTWGHDVVVLTTTPDRSRGLAESLPPSTQRVLAEVGVLDAVLTSTGVKIPVAPGETPTTAEVAATVAP